MTTHQLDIEGMSCEHCVRAVRGALEGVAGVRKIDVRVGHADVETDDTIARDALVRAIEAEDFRVRA